MTRLALLLGAALGLALAPPASAQSDAPLDSLRARVARGDAPGAREALAVRLVADGQLGAAVPHLRQLVAETPERADLALQLARVLGWSGQEQEAIAAYDAVLGRGPDAAAAYELARLLTWNGDADRAVDLLAPLAARQPDAPALQSALAYALHAAGRTGAARRQYARALRLTPDDAVLLFESGTLERWEGDWSLGRARIQRALSLGLSDEAADRARTLLAALDREHAPRIGTGIVYSTDSNGLTRNRVPSHTRYVVNSAWAGGVEIVQERLAQDGLSQPGATSEAAATLVAPSVAYTPVRSVALRAGAGVQVVHGQASGASGWLDGTWRRTAPRYVAVTGRLRSEAGVDGVRALDEGIRVTSLTAESYAEPLAGWGLGVSLKGTSYSDGNRRGELSTSTRVGIRQLGPVRLGAIGGLGYEDTATIYTGSDPYWTPNDLLTVLGGGVASFAPTEGVLVEPEVYATFQRDPSVHSLSLGYRLRARLDLGRHRAGLVAEQSGSASYAVQRFGLTYEVALW